jgi:hypothetical protein
LCKKEKEEKIREDRRPSDEYFIYLSKVVRSAILGIHWLIKGRRFEAKTERGLAGKTMHPGQLRLYHHSRS